VKTGHENMGHARQIVDQFWPHGDDLSRPGAHGQVLVGLAVYFTAVASDTTFGILKEVIFAHRFASDSGIKFS
jgi:hypothetical protein